MKIILSVAMSIDGYIDDASSERLMLSSPEDFEAVRKLRAKCDAILVGANTIRKDNPSLLSANPDLKKVTLTRSGNIDPQSRFFQTGEAEKIVYNDTTIKELLDDLATTHGVQSLMVEGGAQILNQFLSSGLFDTLRLAIAPIFVKDKNAPYLNFSKQMPALTVDKTETYGDTKIIYFRRV